MNLVEKYRRKISVAEGLYARNHEGRPMTQSQKITLSQMLNNTEKFLNESLGLPASATASTQAGMHAGQFNPDTGDAYGNTAVNTAGLGDWKRFCLTLTTIVTPNLIANDVAMVSPMASISGYVTYIEYVAGVNKGQAAQGQVLASPFQYEVGIDPDYTGQAVVENITTDQQGKAFAPAWTPLKPFLGSDGKTSVIVEFLDANGDVITADGGVIAVPATGAITAPADITVPSTAVKARYMYDNVVIPQDKLPTISAQMKSIALVAKARRVAVYYSQIAQFQAKTDYGFDLSAQLAEQAANQLAYEIDVEILNKLADTAATNQAFTWDINDEGGFEFVSRAERYEGFVETVEKARMWVYEQTHRFAPNYMVVSPTLLPLLSFLRGFQARNASNINGPYVAGTLNGMKVIVSPTLKANTWFVGVNGDDMMSSAIVYAPYMPIVPTQLLGFADGTMSQGFSTVYALEVLNPNLVVGGTVVLALAPVGVRVQGIANGTPIETSTATAGD